ncbi:MAG: hypothetical protein HC830_04360 [Bacteroidetes bacterium]|nr:hypothetical protein [Bacteroidota bacterium]
MKDYKGKRVKMAGYLKTQGTTERAQMWIRVDNIEKKMSTEFDNMDNRPVVGIKNWVKQEIIFDVPLEESVIFYGAFIIGVGKIWFDNVSFEIVDKMLLKQAGC